MLQETYAFPRLAFWVAGAAVGLLIRRTQPRAAAAPELKRSLENLAREMKLQEGRLGRLEARVSGQEAKLREAPSTAQILSAMDDLLARALAGLDARLTAQAQSIETLQMTVRQTDELLERVLESLDLLRSESSEPVA